MSLSAIAQRSTVSRPATASRRSAVVAKASVESRRAVLSGFLAGAALTLTGSVNAAATPVDIIDDRKVIAKGFNNIYEARDASLPENQRQGRTQARTDIASTLAHAKASEARIDSAIEPSIKKNYWTEAREELRRQVGTLRFDLNTLAQAKPKEEKKRALELRKDFIAKVEALDLSLRKKDETASLAGLTAAKAALDAVLAAV